jgi:hypothetical protein
MQAFIPRSESISNYLPGRASTSITRQSLHDIQPDGIKSVDFDDETKRTTEESPDQCRINSRWICLALYDTTHGTHARRKWWSTALVDRSMPNTDTPWASARSSAAPPTPHPRSRTRSPRFRSSLAASSLVLSAHVQACLVICQS